MTREGEEAIWSQICQGKRCCICEEPFAPPYTQHFCFCLACVPDAADVPHSVSINVDHHVEGYSAHVVCDEDPPWVLWMVALSKDQVSKLLEKGRTSPFQRAASQRGLHEWGRTSMATHLDDDEYRLLHEAWRRDPRTGYEKVQAMQRRGR